LGFGVWGLGFGVWGLRFGVWGLGFGVWGLGFGVCERRRRDQSTPGREKTIFKAHRLLYHSTLGLRVIKKKKKGVRTPHLLSRSASANPFA